MIVRIGLVFVAFAIANHSLALAANVTPTSATFKKNQILRDADQMASGSDLQINQIDSGSMANTHDDITNDELSLEDQVRLLTKQMNALMIRRREDFKLLENNLKKSLRKNYAQYGDVDVRVEFEKLRWDSQSIYFSIFSLYFM